MLPGGLGRRFLEGILLLILEVVLLVEVPVFRDDLRLLGHFWLLSGLMHAIPAQKFIELWNDGVLKRPDCKI